MNKFWKCKCFYHGYLPKKGELSMLPAFNIFETSVIFFLKFSSGIELRSIEKYIPSSLKLDADQSNLKSGQQI